MQFTAQFITNDQGDPIYAVVPIDDYREIERRMATENGLPIDAVEEPIGETTQPAGDSPGQPEEPQTFANEWWRNLFAFSEKGVVARARYENHTLVIEAGSEATKYESHSFENDKSCASAWRRRRELIDQGVLKDVGDKLVFTQDVPCESPTEAAQLVCGNSRSGPDAWRDIDGRSFKEVQPNAAFVRRRRGA